MASNNTRDVTPDDFGPDDVPSYTSRDTNAEANTEAFPSAMSPTEPTEQFLRADPTPEELLAQTEHISEASYDAPEPNVSYGSVSHETAAIDREPAYIAPTDPLYEETTVVTEPVAPLEPVTPVEPVGRGTIDFGLLLLRLVFGGYLVLSSLMTFFRLGNSDGIGGLESEFANYPFGNGLAIVVPTLELAAGVFLILGLITPVAAAVAVAVTAFTALHAITTSGLGWNPLYWDATIWLPIVLLAIALAVQFTGPGFYGVDAGRTWARRPLASSWIWLVVGLAAAVAMWWFGTELNPFTTETLPTPTTS